MKDTSARTCYYLGMKWEPRIFRCGTWLEAESSCYPHGGKTRRARALCPDGKLRIFRCGIPDTFFSIPTDAGGFLSMDTDRDLLKFTPYEKKEK